MQQRQTNREIRYECFWFASWPGPVGGELFNHSDLQTKKKKKKKNYSRERGNWSKKRWPQRVGFIYSSSTVTYMKTSVFCFLQRSNNLMNSWFSFIAKVPFSQKAYLVGWNYFKGLFAIIWLMYVFLLHISLSKILLQNKL